ncbi:zinc finger protein interacting with ribonucleoprotein K-like [Drosophila gunungcola]|uniref:zinc finger protein interacting with ribonucleoprotein K-like n=1 Tax=Drosophila gunungcola TaxID=103775 RepID=UPI0022E45342|nr:zinc finger protein interacting with ribonucleoprotein K-like [Drosophila gunungcola]
MSSTICRVCLMNNETMVNIFDAKHESGISIANVISKCTGYKVELEDRLPKNICESCLQDAQNAFDIIDTYERSHQIFSFFIDVRKVKRESPHSNCSKEGTIEKEESHGENGKALKGAEDEIERSHQVFSFLKDVREENQDSTDFNCSEEGTTEKEESPGGNKKMENGKGEGNDNDDGNSKNVDDHRLNCPQCAKNIHKRSLKRHLRTHIEDRPHKCSHCSKSYTSHPQLKLHLKTHSGERAFKCSVCSKTFNQKSHLGPHLRIHTGERPYKCSICSNSFSQNATMLSHMRTHSEERPFGCSQCPKTFRQKAGLRGHMITHSQERPYSCSHCFTTSRTKSNLKKHMLTHTRERPFK